MGLRKPFLRGGHWYCDIDRKRISLKTRDKAVAMRVFAEIKRQYLADRLVKLSGECRVTLGQFAAEYENWAKAEQPRNTFRANRLALQKLRRIAGDDCRLDRISLRHLDQMAAECARAKLSPASINNYIRHLRTVLRKAVEWDHIAVNPFRGARMRPQEKRPPSYIKQSEAAKVLAAVEDMDLRRLMAAYLATGRRRNELLALKWEDFKWEDGLYTIHKAKRHLTRDYPLNDSFAAILESIGRKETGRVFDRWDHGDTVSHLVKAALRLCGFGKLRLHDLRHSFASAFIRAGGDLFTLKELLGHTEFKTTLIYAHCDEELLYTEVNRVKLGPVDLLGNADKMRTAK